MSNTYRDLNAQWQRLCHGTESGPDVAAALAAWSRECLPLADITTLDQALAGIRSNRDGRVLRYLVCRAQRGDTIAHRTVFEAYLPALAAGTATEDDTTTVLGEAWTVIIDAPTDRNGNLSAWIGLRMRHLSSPSTHREIPCAEITSAAEDFTTPDFDLDVLLTSLTPKDQQLLRLIYRDGYSASQAAERMGISTSAAKKRHSRAATTLRSRLLAAA